MSLDLLFFGFFFFLFLFLLVLFRLFLFPIRQQAEKLFERRFRGFRQRVYFDRNVDGFFRIHSRAVRPAAFRVFFLELFRFLFVGREEAVNHAHTAVVIHLGAVKCYRHWSSRRYSVSVSSAFVKSVGAISWKYRTTSTRDRKPSFARMVLT